MAHIARVGGYTTFAALTGGLVVLLQGCLLLTALLIQANLVAIGFGQL